MKKILSIILSCLLILGMIPFGVFAEEATATTYTIPEMAGKYKTQGRTSIVNNVLMTDYTATGMEFIANCSGDVSVTFNASSFSNKYAGTDLGGCYYTVIIDGVKKARDFCYISETGDVTVKIAENLAEGNHTFEIYRQSEIELANIGIKAITLSGELLDAPKNNDMYIEFVGASQWGGYGNLATNETASDDVPSAYYQDGTQALTYLTARNLEADWSVVSVQGIGASWGWQSTSMDTVYKYLRYNKDKTTLYDFARQPDYVVIGLGTNDYNRMEANGKTTVDLVNSFVDFISLIREKNPNAKIIWVCNMMTSDVNTYVEQAVSTSGGAAKGVYSLAVTKNTDGGKNHPSVAGHKVMADEITAFINELETPVENDENKVTSGFENWYTTHSSRVTYVDEDEDGVNDYVSLTTGSNNNTTFIATNPITLVPGTEYELTYYARVPSDSAEFSNILQSDGTTKNYAPQIAIYQPELSEDGTTATTTYQESKNDYAYKGNGTTTLLRRSDFTSNWQIGNYDPYTLSNYSVFYTKHYNACDNVSPNTVYADWTKVTVTFTALEDENNLGDATVAVMFGVKKAAANLKFEVKDVVLKEKVEEEPEVPKEPEETPEEPEELPEGTLFYEDFEDISDPTTVINDVLDSSWARPKLCTTEYVSGSKSISVYGMWQNILMPLDTSIFTDGTIYEFSFNWKMLEYTSTKKRELQAVQLVGWNPSKGEAFKTSYTNLSGSFGTVKATGDWVNTHARFIWRDSFVEDYEQIAIRIYYSTSSPHSQAEDTMYIDDLKITLAENQEFIPLELNEAERTEDTIKVLAFGNSFSNDGTTLIDDIAAADSTDIRVADCSIGGCSLERHYGNMLNGTADYSLAYRTITGTTNFSNVSMQQALTAADWDYITIQQVSGKSGLIDTFEPYLGELLTYFKEMCPDAEILFHATWAYAQDSTHQDFPTYDSNQTKMHEAIEDTYLQVSQNYGFVPLIPTGDAIRRARATSMGDNFNRDGYHLNDKGRLVAALTWYETFTGICALDAKVDLANVIGTVGDSKDVAIGVTDEESLLIRTAAHEAASAFKKANETQLAIEAIGTVDANSGAAISKAVALRNELNNDDLLPNLQTLLDAEEAYSAFASPLKAGDINGDGNVDLNDVVTLAQYVAGWDVEVAMSAVNVNGDTVNGDLNDVVHLAQYVAGWDGIVLYLNSDSSDTEPDPNPDSDPSNDVDINVGN